MPFSCGLGNPFSRYSTLHLTAIPCADSDLHGCLPPNSLLTVCVRRTAVYATRPRSPRIYLCKTVALSDGVAVSPARCVSRASAFLTQLPMNSATSGTTAFPVDLILSTRLETPLSIRGTLDSFDHRLARLSI